MDINANKGVARHPRRKMFGSPLQSMLSSMQLQWDTQNKYLDEVGYSGRRVLGFKLPSWQRPEVWSDEQSTRFIESIWLGVGIGSYMVNFRQGGEDENHLLLLDGQQRLRAIERYWRGELAIPGEDGVRHRWTDLDEPEQRQFLRIPFPWIMTEYQTELELREAYNRHNFGGTAHSLEQRA
jgi:hypothetical protein